MSLAVRQKNLDGLGQAGDVEAEGAGLALEADLSLPVDQVQAIWPAGVGALSGVPGIVDERRELDLQVADAGDGYVRTLVLVFGVGEKHLLAQVDGQLPAVCRVRLLDDGSGSGAVVAGYAGDVGYLVAFNLHRARLPENSTLRRWPQPITCLALNMQ